MSNVFKAIGKAMGDSIAEKQDFDFWLLASGVTLDCVRCDRQYKRRGWLIRHYRKTKHWRRVE